MKKLLPFVLICSLLMPGQANADPPAETETDWYGWQMLPGDVVSWIATGSALFSGSRYPNVYLAGVGVGVGLLNGPVVHWSNGHAGRGFASLGMRVGGALLGGLLGFGSGRGMGKIVYAALGGFLGLLVAQIVDLAVVARDEVSVGKGSSSLRRAPLMLRFGSAF